MDELQYVFSGKVKTPYAFQDEDSGEMKYGFKVSGMGATINIVCDGREKEQVEAMTGKMVDVKGELAYNPAKRTCSFVYGSVAQRK